MHSIFMNHTENLELNDSFLDLSRNKYGPLKKKSGPFGDSKFFFFLFFWPFQLPIVEIKESSHSDAVSALVILAACSLYMD